MLTKVHKRHCLRTITLSRCVSCAANTPCISSVCNAHRLHTDASATVCYLCKYHTDYSTVCYHNRLHTVDSNKGVQRAQRYQRRSCWAVLAYDRVAICARYTPLSFQRCVSSCDSIPCCNRCGTYVDSIPWLTHPCVIYVRYTHR